MQLRAVGEREREERRIGGARLGERDDVGRRERVLSDLLGDPRTVLDRGGDQLGVAAADLEVVEPRADLVVRKLAGERLEPEAPGRNAEAVLRVQLAETVEEADGLVVRDDVWMDLLLGAELGQPRDRVADVALLEERDQLVAQARTREVADVAGGDAVAGEPGGVLVHAEAVAVLVADRAEDAGRVVDERAVVEDADAAGLGGRCGLRTDRRARRPRRL